MLFAVQQQWKIVMRAFTDHPASVGETYGEHLVSAWGFAFTLLAAAVACWLHGVFPFAFQSSGSRRVMTLHSRMVANRRRALAPPPGADLAAGI